eukprot:5947428-Pleurochrysis_carterae.AAC.4
MLPSTRRWRAQKLIHTRQHQTYTHSRTNAARQCRQTVTAIHAQAFSVKHASSRMDNQTDGRTTHKSLA